jgi:hypothetical protein
VRAYVPADLSPLPWPEFGAAFETLARKVGRRKRFDAVVPVLRSGAVVGGMLAVRLGITAVLPIQLKYARGPTRIVTVVRLPRGVALPPKPRILVCDVNLSTGATVTEAVRQVRVLHPGASVTVAVLALVHGGPRSIEGAESLLHGIETNEALLPGAGPDVRPGATLFPWERPEDELRELNAETPGPPRVYQSSKGARRTRRPGGRDRC